MYASSFGIHLPRICLTTAIHYSTKTEDEIKPNVVVEWLKLLLRIHEVQDSNLDLETGYAD
jgi:hypothetical protein